MGGKLDRLPVTSLTGAGGTVNVEMQKAMGIYWPDAHKDPEKMANLAIASYELSGLECVRVPFDIGVEAEAFGCKLNFGGMDLQPSVIQCNYNSPNDLKMPGDPLRLGRIPVVLQAIRILREKVGDFLPIVSNVIGPFTIASVLVGIDNFMKWILRKPEYVKSFLDFSTEIVIEFAKAQYRSGSDIIHICEPSASPSLISPNNFRQFAKSALTRVADNLGGIRLIYIGGNVEPIISDIAELGYDGIAVEDSVNISKIKPLVGNAKILGNLSPIKNLLFGSPEDVKAEAKKAIEDGVDIVEISGGIAPLAPTINIKAMVEAVKEFGHRA